MRAAVQHIPLSYGYYDAAAYSPERDYGSYMGGLSEDHTFSVGDRATALARLRREVRNNPYLAGLVNKFPEAVGCSTLRSRTASTAYNDALELFWYNWSRAALRNGDSLRTLEAIITRELLLAGEIFIVFGKGGRLQVISSEFCRSGDKAPKNEVAGIRYSRSTGAPTHYSFARIDEAGRMATDQMTTVPAKDVIHIFDRDRVLQGRGLPWLLPSLQAARDLYEITRSKTTQIKGVTDIIGVVSKQTGTQGLGAWMTPSGYQPDGTTLATETADSPADPVEPDKRQIQLKAGTLAQLEDNERVDLLSSKYEAGDYKELIMLMLHAISAPVGLPVELWFSGLGDVNYSGFKGLGTQWNARRRHLTRLLEDRFLNRLLRWRRGYAALAGELPPVPAGRDDLFEWAWRRTPVLDDEKHAQAVARRLESGEACLSDIWEEDGYYAEEVFAKRRDLYLKALAAAGEEVTPETKVPLDFLFTNVPSGGVGNSTAPAAPDPGSTPGASTTSDPDDDDDDDTA